MAYMKIQLTIILLFLSFLCLSAFAVGTYLDSTAAFALSAAALLPLVGIFAVGVLDYKVGGSQLTLEKRVNSLEQENTELKKVVTALLKSQHVIVHGTSIFAGVTDKHHALISKYLQPIEHLIDEDIKKKVAEDLEKIMQILRTESAPIQNG